MPTSTDTPAVKPIAASGVFTATIKRDPLVDANITDVSFVDARHGWIIVGTALLATSDGGAHWRLCFTAQTPFVQIDFVSVTRGWAVISDSLLRSTDGGNTWDAVPVPAAMGMHTRVVTLKPMIDFVDARTGWVGGSNRLLYTRDAGLHWEAQSLPCLSPGESGDPAGFSFISPTVGWFVCVGQPATILEPKQYFKTTDGGHTWKFQGELPITGHFSRLAFVDQHHGWMTAGRVGIYITDDGGASWKILEKFFIDDSAVDQPSVITPHRAFVLSGTRNTLIATVDGGKTWRQIYPALSPIGPVFFADDRHGIGIGTDLDPTLQLRTDDGGEHWLVTVLTPVEARILVQIKQDHAAPEDVQFVDWRIGWKLSQNSISMTRDSGVTWTNIPLDYHVWEMRVLPNGIVWLVCDNRSRSDHEHRSVLVTINDVGNSWAEFKVGDIEITQLCFADNQHGWMLDTNEHLYTTSDQGRSWTQLH